MENKEPMKMPVNRLCQKCGWVHAVGSECPLDRAVFGGKGQQTSVMKQVSCPKCRHRFAVKVERLGR